MRRKNYLVTSLLILTWFFVMPILGLQSSSLNISSYGMIRYRWLHTDGRWIKDSTGRIVRLQGACVDWRFIFANGYHDYDPLSYDDEINEASMDTFKTIGNFIRITVNGWLWYIIKAPKYIAAIDTVIGWCKARGIMVVLCNHWWYDTDAGVQYWSGTTELANKEQISELTKWREFMVSMSERYADEPTVIGFDVFNEPLGWPYEDIPWDLWITNVLEVVRAIHAVDPKYLCFVEPLGSSIERDDMDYFKRNPLPEPNIVYCAHKYYAWNYPYQEYAIAYGEGRFEEAKTLMEQRYYEEVFDMMDANLPVIMMETGVYRDIPNKNPNWEVWMEDSLKLYAKYGVSVCWYLFDPDREESSIISLLKGDKSGLTSVGHIWKDYLG